MERTARPLVLAVSSSSSSWTVLSAMSAGVDLTDAPVEINGQDVTDVVVTLGNRPTNLSGEVTIPSGEAARDGWVIVFSTDRATWRPLSRRVFATQITADGRYSTVAGCRRAVFRRRDGRRRGADGMTRRSCADCGRIDGEGVAAGR